jgi:hypothetical protein
MIKNDRATQKCFYSFEEFKKRILSLFKTKDFTTDLTSTTLEPSRAPF